MGTCLIPNCRKQTPSSEPFCVDHRDPPTLEQKYNAAMHNWTVQRREGSRPRRFRERRSRPFLHDGSQMTNLYRRFAT